MVNKIHVVFVAAKPSGKSKRAGVESMLCAYTQRELAEQVRDTYMRERPAFTARIASVILTDEAAIHLGL